MKPKKIIVLRHGESEANINKDIMLEKPDHLIDLTSNGETQCLELGITLQPILEGQSVTVWSSPFLRSRRTTQLFTSQLEHSQVRLLEDPRIREQEWGNFFNEDIYESEKENLQRHSRFFYRIQNGESGADVFDRISSFLDSMFRESARNPSDAILISTHGMTAMIFLKRFFHLTFEQHAEMPWFGNCGFVLLELDHNNKYQITTDARAGANQA